MWDKLHNVCLIRRPKPQWDGKYTISYSLNQLQLIHLMRNNLWIVVCLVGGIINVPMAAKSMIEVFFDYTFRLDKGEIKFFQPTQHVWIKLCDGFLVSLKIIAYITSSIYELTKNLPWILKENFYLIFPPFENAIRFLGRFLCRIISFRWMLAGAYTSTNITINKALVLMHPFWNIYCFFHEPLHLDAIHLKNLDCIYMREMS